MMEGLMIVLAVVAMAVISGLAALVLMVLACVLWDQCEDRKDRT